MKRVYEIYDPEGKKLPEGVKRRIHVREPAHYPTATHWIWWQRGYLDCNPNMAGQIDAYDQTIGFPVRRLQ